jgi:hypothetical protein
VCEPAKDGLIMGRVEYEFPVLFVNAVSYRGLLDAAMLASRLGKTADANRWRGQAASIKAAWERAFNAPDDRALVAALWPSGIAAAVPDRLRQGLERDWAHSRDRFGALKDIPAWTNLELAKAHQWLWLSDSEHVWPTVQWFWEHQLSPGLYTWWTIQNGSNTLHRWNTIRTTRMPLHVTPYYWTAAEMVLLQLDMLAYDDLAAAEPTVVVGAGVPPDWLRHSMTIRGLLLRSGDLDWSWDGKQVRIEGLPQIVKVRLGSAFPPDTPVVQASRHSRRTH